VIVIFGYPRLYEALVLNIVSQCFSVCTSSVICSSAPKV
jgi:hypothetical protein